MTRRRRTVGRTVRVGTRVTSLKLESPFWTGLEIIAKRERLTVGEILCSIDMTRQDGLTASVRTFVVAYLLACQDAGRTPEIGRVIQSLAA